MENNIQEQEEPQNIPQPIQSLKELVDMVSGRRMTEKMPKEDSGLADVLPFPFLGIVGQLEMKLAILLAVINPNIGGVLLIGPRGTAKTTAVRSLLDLLPDVERSICFYGCTPQDVISGGVEAVCPDCAKKYGEGAPLTKSDAMRIVELPLNSQLDDVIGQVNETAVLHERMRIKRGILAHSDQNLLFVDEVNMLQAEIINAILDAAAFGCYTIKRGTLSATYKSRMILLGSMNPEEGDIRPQILDRFGLRVIVQGLIDPIERLEAYHRVQLFKTNPRHFTAKFSTETKLAREEIISAQELLPSVSIRDEIALMGVALIKMLKIDSLRAEMTLFEAAKAYAAADARDHVEVADIFVVAPAALRLRRSAFMKNYLRISGKETKELEKALYRVT